MDIDNSDKKNVGKKIRELRIKNGLTQSELAKKINKGLRTIQKYESGELRVSIELLKKLSLIFNEPIENIVYRKENESIFDDLDIIKKGRHETVSNEELYKALLEFILNNEGKINLSRLEKATGIKRHVWGRRMKKEIEQFNTNQSRIDCNKILGISIPRTTDVLIKYVDDKTALEKAFSKYDDSIQLLLNSTLAVIAKNKELEDKIAKLEAEKK